MKNSKNQLLIALILAALPASAANKGESRVVPAAPSIPSGVTAVPGLLNPVGVPSAGIVPSANSSNIPALPEAKAQRAAAVSAPGPKQLEPVAQGQDQSAKPSAIAQLRRELKTLQSQEKDAKAFANSSGMLAHEYKGKGGAEESYGRASENLSAVRSKIDAKKGEIEAARKAELARYRALKGELAVLKAQRDAAKAEASISGTVGHDFKGGADEARARALERAASFEGQMAAKKKELALIERDNPGFAGLLAPVVVIKNAFGLAPVTEAEQKLTDEIAQLKRERAQVQAASSIPIEMSAAEARGRAGDEMARLDGLIEAKQKALKDLR